MKTNNKKMSTQNLVLLALLTALVAVLSYFGGFIKIGGFASVNLTLVPVVLGAALCGQYAGAWLGGVSGIVFFMTADAPFWLGLNAPGTVITVMIKGIMAGLLAGLVFNLLKKHNRYLAIIASAVVAPIVNTGIFILGCFIFFLDGVRDMASAGKMSVGALIIVGFVGLNFVFELIFNIVLSPAIARVLDVADKTFKKYKKTAVKVTEPIEEKSQEN